MHGLGFGGREMSQVVETDDARDRQPAGHQRGQVIGHELRGADPVAVQADPEQVVDLRDRAGGRDQVAERRDVAQVEPAAAQPGPGRRAHRGRSANRAAYEAGVRKWWYSAELGSTTLLENERSAASFGSDRTTETVIRLSPAAGPIGLASRVAGSTSAVRRAGAAWTVDSGGTTNTGACDRDRPPRAPNPATAHELYAALTPPISTASNGLEHRTDRRRVPHC